MRRLNRTWQLLAGMLFFSVAACSTYTYMPSLSKQPPPPEGEAGASAPVVPPELKAEPISAMKALEDRVQKLESRLEELEHRLPHPVAAKETKAAGPRPKPAPGEKVVAAKPAGKPQVVAPPPGYPLPPGAPDKAYSEALSLYQSKKYASAREKFHQYLRSQPKGPKAPEARYHLADSFFQEKQYKEAANEFNKVALQHPQNILAPTAMLRQALAYKNLQQTPNYRTTLKKLVQTYPNSPEAQEAQKWLKEGK
ncbi:MAG: hypothetical protein A2Y80_05385 [Deltaproteobacteria bacterium RBG_13_58_19]|nr:MAG: hypothetical protein A2Y80_05385 [Deltaproteobacteria bacterium RBG_13_58_19]